MLTTEICPTLVGLYSTSFGSKNQSYLKVVCLVVVHVERPVEFCVPAHRQVFGHRHTLIDGLPGKLLHLNVVKLSKVAEPLDQLGGDAPIKLGVKKINACIKSNTSKNKGSDVYFLRRIHQNDGIGSICQLYLPVDTDSNSKE